MLLLHLQLDAQPSIQPCALSGNQICDLVQFTGQCFNQPGLAFSFFKKKIEIGRFGIILLTLLPTRESIAMGIVLFSEIVLKMLNCSVYSSLSVLLWRYDWRC